MGLHPGKSGWRGRHDETLSTRAGEECNRGRWMETRGLEEKSVLPCGMLVVNRVSLCVAPIDRMCLPRVFQACTPVYFYGFHFCLYYQNPKHSIV